MLQRAAPVAIETDRLLLHQPSSADAPEIFGRYASDPDVTRYLSFRRHESLADTHLFVDFSRMEWAANGCGPYLVRARDSGVLLGGTGLSLQGDEAETGYVFARDAWGRGYATEALTAMVEVGRAVGLRGLVARCHPDHQVSIHVLEKCGFALELRSNACLLLPNLSSDKQDLLVYTISLARRTPSSPGG